MIVLFYKLLKDNDTFIEYNNSPIVLECTIDI